MSDFARQDEAIRAARGPFTQRQNLAGTQSAALVMNDLETAVSIAVSAGNTSISIKLPPNPVAGDAATIKWNGNACRSAVVTDGAALYSVRVGPSYAGEMNKFRFSGGAWQAIGP